MKSVFIFVFCIVNLSLLIKAQSSLYLPGNLEKAYTNGTRNYNGTPGKNYWQNSANYRISA
ncbi:MAG: hypothetical protein COZ80_12350, partial [Ignavibacteria bacterium CG_4_8_14_3_um_filter_37_9]